MTRKRIAAGLIAVPLLLGGVDSCALMIALTGTDACCPAGPNDGAAPAGAHHPDDCCQPVWAVVPDVAWYPPSAHPVDAALRAVTGGATPAASRLFRPPIA